MISVLIPIYNYCVVDLVREIHKQLIDNDLTFEILCLEDGSNNAFVKKNLVINNLSNTSLIVSELNNGRIKSRKNLCDRAKYDWLLFLDADVMPKSNRFILNYLECQYEKYDVVYGGFIYHNTPPEQQFTLRWKYGRTHEEVDAKIRNTEPYKVVISANFLVRKSIYTSISSEINFDTYGTDIVLGSLLKEHSVKVFHINNEVYHLGLEDNLSYLHKKEQAADILIELIKNKKVKHENSLLSLFMVLKRYGLHYLFMMFFKIFRSSMKRNLIGKKPIMPILQLYRISYMCNAYIKTKS